VGREALYLFTGWFPFGSNVENNFLTPEIEYLAKKFKKIIIIPEIIEGSQTPVPENVIVDISCARPKNSFRERNAYIIKGLRSVVFWREIKNHLYLIFHLKFALQIAYTVGRALKVREWVISRIEKQKIDLDEGLFYTYWLTNAVIGIQFAKKQCPGLKVISRAHRFDLYEYQHNLSYIPFREETLAALDLLFCISEDGKNYIDNKYPWFASRCKVARLGVESSGFLCRPSQDGAIRIVSCSYLVPFKRVEMILRCIKLLASQYPDRVFEWHHLGGGPLLDDIHTQAADSPINLKCYLPGTISAKEVLEYYRQHALDVFINLSSSEGISVAMMEAISCGLPVVATNVGGTSEIISNANGVLLGQQPEPREVARAIWRIVSDTEAYQVLRLRSHQIWNASYNASINYQAFADTLLKL
jgi:colanic acid/amylovoran biosynthesis glycosyltransferase